MLTKTLKEAGFDGVFTEVAHTESFELKNPNHLRLFHLNVENNAFSLDALHSFLSRNIGRYVFSRAKIDQFKVDDDVEAIGLKAIGLLRKAANLDADWIDGQLGDVLLYIFLEQILDAPKLLSKFELVQSNSLNVLNSGGVHLLPLESNGTMPSFQLIFGKSNVHGDLRDAIDEAFVSLSAIRDNTSDEMQLVEGTLFSQSFDQATTDYLKQIIIPSQRKNIVVDKAFGVFLGYSIGLTPENYSNIDFRRELVRKMDTDIKAHVAYISQKINAAKMEAHSFYFYVLPFNDADTEKKIVMNALLEGGA